VEAFCTKSSSWPLSVKMKATPSLKEFASITYGLDYQRFIAADDDFEVLYGH